MNTNNDNPGSPVHHLVGQLLKIADAIVNYSDSVITDTVWLTETETVVDAIRFVAEEINLASCWSDIKTAPRGSGDTGPDRCDHVDYIDPPKLLLYSLEGMHVGYYDWYYHPGFGHGAHLKESPWRDNSSGEGINPTHWMPLPSLPNATDDRTPSGVPDHQLVGRLNIEGEQQ